jgi:hypothetical protein
MSEPRRAAISVGEPWDFEGNDGPNRLVVDHVGEVPGPGLRNWASRYLLLRVVSPFDYRSERVEWLIASPRYKGVTIDMLAENGGTAGISRLRPGVRLAEDKPFETDDVEYFMIGGINFVR